MASLSQEALANASSMDRLQFGRIERGERNLTVPNLGRIAQASNMPASELLRSAEA